MTMNLTYLQRIEDVPFAAIMRRSGTTPVLLDFLLPDMDIVIWQLRPCVRQATNMELRQATLRALDYAIEHADRPGTAIYEFDGFSLFAFRRVDRAEILAQMDITKIKAI